MLNKKKGFELTIDIYQNTEKAVIDTDGLCIRPLLENIKEEELGKKLDNEVRMYPWYTYQGQEVAIVKKTCFMYSKKFPFKGLAIARYWDDQLHEYNDDVATIIVPLRDVRLYNLNLWMVGKGFDTLEAVESLEREARGVYIDYKNRKKSLIEIRDILLRHNGKEIKKIRPNNNCEYFELA